MILKILVGDTWEFFDGYDRVSLREISPKEDFAAREDGYDFRKQQERDADSNPNPVMEMWLYKGKQEVSQIVAHRPIYILNDAGKTIERA